MESGSTPAHYQHRSDLRCGTPRHHCTMADNGGSARGGGRGGRSGGSNRGGGSRSNRTRRTNRTVIVVPPPTGVLTTRADDDDYLAGMTGSVDKTTERIERELSLLVMNSRPDDCTKLQVCVLSAVLIYLFMLGRVCGMFTFNDNKPIIML